MGLLHNAVAQSCDFDHAGAREINQPGGDGGSFFRGVGGYLQRVAGLV